MKPTLLQVWVRKSGALNSLPQQPRLLHHAHTLSLTWYNLWSKGSHGCRAKRSWLCEHHLTQELKSLCSVSAEAGWYNIDCPRKLEANKLLGLMRSGPQHQIHISFRYHLHQVHQNIKKLTMLWHNSVVSFTLLSRCWVHCLQVWNYRGNPSCCSPRSRPKSPRVLPAQNPSKINPLHTSLTWAWRYPLHGSPLTGAHRRCHVTARSNVSVALLI